MIAIGSSGGTVYVSVHSLPKTVSGPHPTATKVFSLAERRLIFELEGHTTYVRALSFSSDGRVLFSGSQDNTVRIWDMGTGALTKVISLESGGNRTSYLRTIAITPLGGLVATGWWDCAIRISDLSTAQLLHCIGTSGNPERLDFSPDGNMCTAGLDNGTLLHIKDLRAEQPETFVYSGHKLPDRVEVRYLQFLAVLPLDQSPSQSKVNRTIVSKDGKWVISGSFAGGVHFTRPLARSANFVMEGIRELTFHKPHNTVTPPSISLGFRLSPWE